MKKLFLAGLSLFACLAISAQTTVKDVENMLKATNPDYAEALKALTPMMSDPATVADVNVWFLAGKSALGLNKDMNIAHSVQGMLTDEQKALAGHSIINGYNYLLTALPLDSIPDAKGKIKPKRSKDIFKMMKESYPGLHNAAVFLLQINDYNGCYDAIEIETTLPFNPMLGKNAPLAPADSILGQETYIQAVAMYTAHDFQRALDKAIQTVDYFYDDIDVYRIGLQSARQIGDRENLLRFAREGYKKYGSEDIQFLGEIINTHLENNDYQGCYEFLNEAVATTPDSNIDIKSQLYDVLGIVNEREEKYDDAIVNFEKAIGVKPDFAKANFDLARMYYNKAVRLDEESSESSRNAEVAPDLLKAAQYFEKAYELDPEGELSQIPSIMYRLYYRLGEGYEDKAALWQTR